MYAIGMYATRLKLTFTALVDNYHMRTEYR